MNFISNKKFLLLAIPVIPLAIGIVFFNGSFDRLVQSVFLSDGDKLEQSDTKQPPPQVKKTRKPAPRVVKAVYSTMYTAGDERMFGRLLKLINNYELNAIVIDVKDSDGRLIFDSINVGDFIRTLDENNVHIIGRVVVFQDNRAAKEHPDIIIRNKSGGVWRDQAGFAWIDPASRGGWDYILNISKQALDAGFDEINYDYIRFPSEGLLDSAVYPAWNASTTKSDTIKNFADFAVTELKRHDPNAIVSIDIFGYTFLRNHDLGIGQKLEDMIERFDYVYPMVYPSHYAPGNFGYQNPAVYPYEVVKKTLDSGLNRLGNKVGERQALSAEKIRPWLQAFNLGAKYTPEMMKAQMQATDDALGEQSAGWLLWDPNNYYKKAEEYLEPES